MHKIEAMGIGRNKGEAALGLVLTADTYEKLCTELAEAKEALLVWKHRNQATCGQVMLTFTLSPELNEVSTVLLDELYSQDGELSSLLRQVSVKVAILNQKRKPVCEYLLGQETAQFRTASNKPWWKFW